MRSWPFARLGDVAVPLLAILFAVAYVAITWSLPKESRIFPHTAAAMVVLFGAILLFQELWGAPDEEAAEAREPSKAPLIFALSAAFVAGLWALGFLVASSVYLFVAQFLLKQPVLRTGAVALGVTAALYVLFAVFLGVQL